MSTVNKALATEAGQTAIKNAIDAIGATNIGNMSALTTTDKTSLVGAVNEVNAGKADKVSGATNGNLAGLDANGNLKDSGIKASDVHAAISQFATSKGIAAGGSASLTVSGNTEFCFLVYGSGWSNNPTLNETLFYVAGFASASRTHVFNLTGQTTVTITASNPDSLTFQINNTNTSAGTSIYALPLSSNVILTWS